jgi:imidazolonepropionase-like amidohydrolase
MEKSGLSALEAIETLTSHGATVIGLNDRGLIRKGKRADILILDQNPLSDIRALFEPNTVIKKGNIIFDRDK